MNKTRKNENSLNLAERINVNSLNHTERINVDTLNLTERIYANSQYIVDAIVYLPKEITKTISKDDWSDDDKSKVDRLLCVLPLFNKK